MEFRMYFHFFSFITRFTAYVRHWRIKNLLVENHILSHIQAYNIFHTYIFHTTGMWEKHGVISCWTYANYEVEPLSKSVSSKLLPLKLTDRNWPVMMADKPRLLNRWTTISDCRTIHRIASLLGSLIERWQIKRKTYIRCLSRIMVWLRWAGITNKL